MANDSPFQLSYHQPRSTLPEQDIHTSPDMCPHTTESADNPTKSRSPSPEPPTHHSSPPELRTSDSDAGSPHTPPCAVVPAEYDPSARPSRAVELLRAPRGKKHLSMTSHLMSAREIASDGGTPSAGASVQQNLDSRFEEAADEENDADYRIPAMTFQGINGTPARPRGGLRGTSPLDRLPRVGGSGLARRQPRGVLGNSHPRPGGGDPNSMLLLGKVGSKRQHGQMIDDAPEGQMGVVKWQRTEMGKHVIRSEPTTPGVTLAGDPPELQELSRRGRLGEGDGARARVQISSAVQRRLDEVSRESVQGKGRPVRASSALRGTVVVDGQITGMAGSTLQLGLSQECTGLDGEDSYTRREMHQWQVSIPEESDVDDAGDSGHDKLVRGQLQGEGGTRYGLGGNQEQGSQGGVAQPSAQGEVQVHVREKGREATSYVPKSAESAVSLETELQHPAAVVKQSSEPLFSPQPSTPRSGNAPADACTQNPRDQGQSRGNVAGDANAGVAGSSVDAGGSVAPRDKEQSVVGGASTRVVAHSEKSRQVDAAQCGHVGWAYQAARGDTQGYGWPQQQSTMADDPGGTMLEGAVEIVGQEVENQHGRQVGQWLVRQESAQDLFVRDNQLRKEVPTQEHAAQASYVSHQQATISSPRPSIALHPNEEQPQLSVQPCTGQLTAFDILAHDSQSQDDPHPWLPSTYTRSLQQPTSAVPPNALETTHSSWPKRQGQLQSSPNAHAHTNAHDSPVEPRVKLIGYAVSNGAHAVDHSSRNMAHTGEWSRKVVNQQRAAQGGARQWLQGDSMLDKQPRQAHPCSMIPPRTLHGVSTNDANAVPKSWLLNVQRHQGNRAAKAPMDLRTVGSYLGYTSGDGKLGKPRQVLTQHTPTPEMHLGQQQDQGVCAFSATQEELYGLSGQQSPGGGPSRGAAVGMLGFEQCLGEPVATPHKLAVHIGTQELAQPELYSQLLELQDNEAIQIVRKPRGQSGMRRRNCAASKALDRDKQGGGEHVLETMNVSGSEHAFAAVEVVRIEQQRHTRAPASEVSGLAACHQATSLPWVETLPQLSPRSTAVLATDNRIPSRVSPQHHPHAEPASISLATHHPIQASCHQPSNMYTVADGDSFKMFLGAEDEEECGEAVVGDMAPSSDAALHERELPGEIVEEVPCEVQLESSPGLRRTQVVVRLEANQTTDGHVSGGDIGCSEGWRGNQADAEACNPREAQLRISGLSASEREQRIVGFNYQLQAATEEDEQGDSRSQLESAELGPGAIGQKLRRGICTAVHAAHDYRQQGGSQYRQQQAKQQQGNRCQLQIGPYPGGPSGSSAIASNIGALLPQATGVAVAKAHSVPHPGGLRLDTEQGSLQVPHAHGDNGQPLFQPSGAIITSSQVSIGDVIAAPSMQRQQNTKSPPAGQQLTGTSQTVSRPSFAFHLLRETGMPTPRLQPSRPGLKGLRCGEKDHLPQLPGNGSVEQQTDWQQRAVQPGPTSVLEAAQNEHCELGTTCTQACTPEHNSNLVQGEGCSPQRDHTRLHEGSSAGNTGGPTNAATNNGACYDCARSHDSEQHIGAANQCLTAHLGTGSCLRSTGGCVLHSVGQPGLTPQQCQQSGTQQNQVAAIPSTGCESEPSLQKPAHVSRELFDRITTCSQQPRQLVNGANQDAQRPLHALQQGLCVGQSGAITSQVTASAPCEEREPRHLGQQHFLQQGGCSSTAQKGVGKPATSAERLNAAAIAKGGIMDTVCRGQCADGGASRMQCQKPAAGTNLASSTADSLAKYGSGHRDKGKQVVRPTQQLNDPQSSNGQEPHRVSGIGVHHGETLGCSASSDCDCYCGPAGEGATVGRVNGQIGPLQKAGRGESNQPSQQQQSVQGLQGEQQHVAGSSFAIPHDHTENPSLRTVTAGPSCDRGLLQNLQLVQVSTLQSGASGARLLGSGTRLQGTGTWQSPSTGRSQPYPTTALSVLAKAASERSLSSAIAWYHRTPSFLNRMFECQPAPFSTYLIDSEDGWKGQNDQQTQNSEGINEQD